LTTTVESFSRIFGDFGSAESVGFNLVEELAHNDRILLPVMKTFDIAVIDGMASAKKSNAQ